MAKCKDAKAQAEAKILEERQKIGSDNIGHQMLKRMGWQEGEGRHNSVIKQFNLVRYP